MDLPRAAPAGYPAPLPRPAGRQNILNTRTPGKQLMVRVQHVGSYYAASSQRAPERPALADGIDCDVCVVGAGDRKSTRLNSSHLVISYAVFCLKKKTSTVL